MIGSEDNYSDNGKNERENKPYKIRDRLKAARRHFLRFIRHSFSRPENFPLHLNWFFTALLACFAFYAWQEATHTTATLQAQLSAQEADFRIDQRPIVIDDNNPPLPPEIRLGITYDKSTSRFGWNYGMKNVGKTTAFNPTNCEYVSVRGGHFKTAWPCRISNDLGPSSGSFGTAFYPDTIGKEDLGKLLLVPGGIIVKVLTTYKDIYGAPYDAFFCYVNNGNHTIGNCSHRQVDKIPTDEYK